MTKLTDIYKCMHYVSLSVGCSQTTQVSVVSIWTLKYQSFHTVNNFILGVSAVQKRRQYSVTSHCNASLVAKANAEGW